MTYECTGKPMDTKRVAGSDTALSLPTAYMGATATRITETGFNRGAGYALLTVEDNAIRFTYNGVTPTNDAGTKVGHVLNAGESLWLQSETQVNSLKWLNKVAGSAGAVVVTPFIALGD